jgi:protocatechuate 3,4-dioxygenase beta subunit
MSRTDDTPRGHLLSRKEALLAIGAGALVAVLPASARAAVPCVAVPELTEGPFFVDEHLDRSDIRSDPTDKSVCPGVPLALTLNLARIVKDNCEPLAGAAVDLWHCDAIGRYSDVGDTLGKKFLRGSQVSDATGRVHFTTIYPGWYPGRTVHIHFKVRASAANGKQFDFTSQFFFDDKLTDGLFQQPPYAQRGPRSHRNPDDDIYLDGGNSLVLTPQKHADTLAATFDLALKLD